jgi:cyclophilin family peptidyl-prolyl cis-trans isomerase
LKSSTYFDAFALGMVAPSKKDRNMNGSQFFITYGEQEDLNHWNVKFGQLYDVKEVLDEIEINGSDEGTSIEDISIHKCQV